ncbi:MAG: ATP-binding protein [Cyanobacteria bacterium]|nr:ATP-binding protein [Cyanobacteriota bacterium]
MYIRRQLEEILNRYLTLFPAVTITGPKQSGKSTMLKECLKDRYKYVTFDKIQNIEDFSSDPQSFIEKYNNKVIFDEAQRVPQLFNYIKLLIDEDRQNYGKFILTGSSQFSMIKGITETLAGRVGNISLLPFQYLEIPDEEKTEQILFGSYPEIVLRKYSGVFEWYESYIQNYIERDVRNLSNIGNLRDFKKFINLLAAKTAQEFNASSYASDIGVNYKTIQSWFSILEASYIVFTIEPYFHNLGKRIIKRPKVYFWDTGLVCYLTGIRTKELLEKGPLCGPVFENYLISEIFKSIKHQNKENKLFYFRSNSGLKSDLIIEDRANKKIIFTEIKYNKTARPVMVENIKKLIEKEKEYQVHTGYDASGLLLYTGSETGKFFGLITYIPWDSFLRQY